MLAVARPKPKRKPDTVTAMKDAAGSAGVCALSLDMADYPNSEHGDHHESDRGHQGSPGESGNAADAVAAGAAIAHPGAKPHQQTGEDCHQGSGFSLNFQPAVEQ